MKIKKAFDVCKKRGSIATCFCNDEQWLFTDAAAYSISELPELGEESICRLYDISDKQREKIHFQIGTDAPGILVKGNCDPSETEAEPMDMDINLSGLGLCTPFRTEQGVAFIQRTFLTPLSDIPDEELLFFCRIGVDKTPYIAVKVGLLLYAVIATVKISEKTVDDLHNLYFAAKTAVENQKTIVVQSTALDDIG